MNFSFNGLLYYSRKQNKTKKGVIMRNNNSLAQRNTSKRRLFATFITMLLTVVAMAGMSVVFAAGAQAAVDKIIEIVCTAAKYIGAVIALWGVFQIILALRREDSEGISKQIITVVVGGSLVGFGAFAPDLFSQLLGG